MSMVVLPVVLVVLLAGASWLAAALVRTVRSDGLGHRPPPPDRLPEAGDGAW